MEYIPNNDNPDDPRFIVFGSLFRGWLMSQITIVQADQRFSASEHFSLGHAPIDFYPELSYNEDHHNPLCSIMLNTNTFVPLYHQLKLPN